MVRMLVRKPPEIMQLVFNKNTISFIGKRLSLDRPSKLISSPSSPRCPDSGPYIIWTCSKLFFSDTDLTTILGCDPLADGKKACIDISSSYPLSIGFHALGGYRNLNPGGFNAMDFVQDRVIFFTFTPFCRFLHRFEVTWWRQNGLCESTQQTGPFWQSQRILKTRARESVIIQSWKGWNINSMASSPWTKLY